VGGPAPGGPRGAYAPVAGTGCDLRSGVPRADDEHVAVAIRNRVHVRGRMHELAGEALAARPFGQIRDAVVAGRDDHGVRLQWSRRGLEPPGIAVALDAVHTGAGAQVETVRLRVALEVLEQVVARHPAAIAARDRQAGEA